MPSLSSLSSQQPKLELDIKNHVRTTRTTTPRRVCQAGTTQCCKQRYTFNFAEIGWDWVIEPTEYVASYCRGTCSSSGPFTFDHSQLASLKAHHITADLTPCCAPERLDPLSIMYLNSNNQITRDILPNMIVTSCGCA
ncbi:inhibin beta E chain-like [Amphiura filiformis]|uniref:inhibin beta E chain-like n=1 Tax=Amphiura filiformis TaxID=82378 RepID=UPI003B228BD9